MTEQEFREDLEESFPAELLLLKEVGSDEYEKFMHKVTYNVRETQLYAERMNKFVDLAAKATGRSYIIDTGSNLDVADALFTMTDEWLDDRRTRTFWQTFRDMLLNLVYGAIAFLPLFFIAGLLYAMTKKWSSAERKRRKT